jgi:hypothetical protein
VPPAVVTIAAWPDAASLQALNETVQLGYYRGILNQLDAIEAARPDCVDFVAAMRELARQFQFEAMSRELARAPEKTMEEKSP